MPHPNIERPKLGSAHRINGGSAMQRTYQHPAEVFASLLTARLFSASHYSCEVRDPYARTIPILEAAGRDWLLSLPDGPEAHIASMFWTLDEDGVPVSRYVPEISQAPKLAVALTIDDAEMAVA